MVLASVLLVPVAIVVTGGRAGYNEFAEWIIGFFLVVGVASLIANVLRRRGRIGAGTLVLFLAIIPFVLLAWFVIQIAQSFRNPNFPV